MYVLIVRFRYHATVPVEGDGTCRVIRIVRRSWEEWFSSDTQGAKHHTEQGHRTEYTPTPF